MSEKPPQPVEVKNADPLPVTVHDVPESAAESAATKLAVSSRVDAEILRTEDQRRISGMWESTQQVIAISVVEITLLVSAIIVASPGVATMCGFTVPPEASTMASTGIVFLASVANLVIGFYFGRTNHSRVGGNTLVGDTRDGN